MGYNNVDVMRIDRTYYNTLRSTTHTHTHSLSKIFDDAERLVQQQQIRAVVLLSLKDQNFIAGADINMIFNISTQEQGE